MTKSKMKQIYSYVGALLLGTLVGILTLLGQATLPNNLNSLANSGAVWLIPAFLLAYFLKQNAKHSIFLCILTLICCVFGYYLFEAAYNHHTFQLYFYLYLWLGCAVVGGTIFGFGAYCASQKTNFLKYAGMNLLPSVFLAEGLSEVIHISDYMHMIPAVIGRIVVGILLYFIINHKESFRPKNVLVLLTITVLGLIGFEAIHFLTI